MVQYKGFISPKLNTLYMVDWAQVLSQVPCWCPCRWLPRCGRPWRRWWWRAPCTCPASRACPSSSSQCSRCTLVKKGVQTDRQTPKKRFGGIDNGVEVVRNRDCICCWRFPVCLMSQRFLWHFKDKLCSGKRLILISKPSTTDSNQLWSWMTKFRPWAILWFSGNKVHPPLPTPAFRPSPKVKYLVNEPLSHSKQPSSEAKPFFKPIIPLGVDIEWHTFLLILGPFSKIVHTQNSLFFHPLDGRLVAGALLRAVRSHHAHETFPGFHTSQWIGVHFV